MQAIVDSLLTTYYRVGSGKQVLVLHGWGDNSLSWRQFATSLGRHYEVITLDLPGFGNTQSPPDDWGLDEYARFVGAFVQKIELKPYAYLGHSNGGAIAIHGLASGVLHANKLVLLASAGIRGEANGRNSAIKAITKTGKLLTTPLPKALRQKLRSSVYSAAGSDLLVAEHLEGTFKRVVSQDIRADAARLQMPTLLVYGTQDTQTPIHYGQLLHAEITGSQLEVIPDADHFLQLSATDVTLQLAEDFLK